MVYGRQISLSIGTEEFHGVDTHRGSSVGSFVVYIDLITIPPKLSFSIPQIHSVLVFCLKRKRLVFFGKQQEEGTSCVLNHRVIISSEEKQTLIYILAVDDGGGWHGNIICSDNDEVTAYKPIGEKQLLQLLLLLLF